VLRVTSSAEMFRSPGANLRPELIGAGRRPEDRSCSPRPVGIAALPPKPARDLQDASMQAEMSVFTLQE
jgi:hypothetical protein